MATIRKEHRTPATADQVWAAFRDYGAPHEKLARGFVVATRLEEGARVVTFANGMVFRELLVTMDDAARRLVYAIVGAEGLVHHNASFQVHPDGAGSRVIWIADVLPDDAAEAISPMMDAGIEALARTIG